MNAALMRVLVWAAAGVCLGGPARAQTDAPVPARQAGGLTGSVPMAGEVVVTPPVDRTPAPTCESLTDRAMSVDLAAANAQAQRTAASEQARLLDQSTSLWRQAEAICTGRARERAQRNLADSEKARAAVSTSSAEGCQASQKDAATLEELARLVLGERRFAEAAGLFRRAESQWDLAAERCAGPLQQQAVQRRESAQADAYNAEHCSPRLQVAMEQTQRLRAAASGLSAPERQSESMVAETLWRDAMAQCKGAPLDLARNQAQAQAQERGTPWVPTRPAAPAQGRPVPPAGAPAAALPAAALPASSPNLSANPVAAPATPMPTAPIPDNVPKSRAEAGALRPRVVQDPSVPRQIDLVVGGGVRLVGVFAADAGSGATTYTGQGKIIFPNGEVYEGAVVRGTRHGVGEFNWLNGQRYRGDWVNDRPVGQGHLRFANGNIFEGAVLDGQPEGQGRMIYASGDVYKGDMHNGEPNGRGEYIWINGQRYDGPWVQGKASGKGAVTFANGNHFEGDLVESVPHGSGRMRYASGEVFEGGFANGLPDGDGSYQWKNGDRYVGQWKAGTKDGRGTLYWANGDKWEGVFRADAPTEQGTLTRAKKP
ncbi:MAG: hypothetical protein IPP44_18560 [Ideonella sp.]|nr:hypothetical protein [Ideonella sp.]